MAAPPAAQPSCAMGSWRVSGRNPMVLMIHAVSEGIMKPVQET